MKSVALTIHFVHQAEIAQLWRDESEALAFCLDPEKQQYKPQMYTKRPVIGAVHGFVWAAIDISPAEF